MIHLVVYCILKGHLPGIAGNELPGMSQQLHGVPSRPIRPSVTVLSDRGRTRRLNSQYTDPNSVDIHAGIDSCGGRIPILLCLHMPSGEYSILFWCTCTYNDLE